MKQSIAFDTLKRQTRAVIKGRGPGIFPSYFEVYSRLLWYKISMFTTLQQLESPVIFWYTLYPDLLQKLVTALQTQNIEMMG